jgi:hypothetical protein
VQPGSTKPHGIAKEQFRREVQKELTGKENEAAELVYFFILCSPRLPLGRIPSHRHEC